jgi:hypothetical protein
MRPLLLRLAGLLPLWILSAGLVGGLLMPRAAQAQTAAASMDVLPAAASLSIQLAAAPVTTVAELVDTVGRAQPGGTILIGPGTFALEKQLDLPAGITLKGAGIDRTVITHADSWQANPATLPDPETDLGRFDQSGYLLRLERDAGDFTISDLTLRGPNMHGAIFGINNRGVHLHHLRIEDFWYAGIRSYVMSFARIHDCVFVDAGQRWDNGQPGVNGGITGGGIFAIWFGDSEIANNRFLMTKTAPNEHYYGIKGREGRRLRIHHNTIAAGFSIELPFEGDEDVEIDHNVLKYAVSIPKYAGGHIPKSGVSFQFHHNYFQDSYSIEFVRNCVEIDHNLFDFDTAQDGGNLISSFGDVAAPGPAYFHNNLVSNPGRGVMWMNEPYGQLEVRNNHIIARTTATLRDDGLFGFNDGSNFDQFRFVDNKIECLGTPRPLFRNDASGRSLVENNQLTNVTDTDRYSNRPTDRPSGLEAPLKFTCGVDGELTVDGWKTYPTPLTERK